MPARPLPEFLQPEGRGHADGSWGFKSDIDSPVWDTCFAILFLRRATRPLNDVASVDRK